MKSPWKKISSIQKYKNSWIRVREDKVIRPDGSKGIYGVVETSGSSAIVALTEINRLYLIKQWRYPLNKFTIELPWGGRERNESYLETAKRELKEEAGVTARTWRKLGAVNDLPGIANEFAYLYLAQNLSHSKPVVIPEESDQVLITIPFSTAIKWIYSKKINDSVTISGIIRAKEYLKL